MGVVGSVGSLLGGQALGGLFGNSAAGNARDAQLAAGNRANANAQAWMQQAQGMYAPWMQQGQQAGNSLQALMNNPQFWQGYGGFQSTAGQFAPGMQPQPQGTGQTTPTGPWTAGRRGAGRLDAPDVRIAPELEGGNWGRTDMGDPGVAGGPAMGSPVAAAPGLTTQGFSRGPVAPTIGNMQTSGALSSLAPSWAQAQPMRSTAGQMQPTNLAGQMGPGTGLEGAGAIQGAPQVGQTNIPGGALNNPLPTYQAGMGATDTAIPQGGYRFNTPGEVQAPQLATNAGTNRIGTGFNLPGGMGAPFQLGQAPGQANFQAPGAAHVNYKPQTIAEMVRSDEGYNFAREEARDAAGQNMAALGLLGSGAHSALQGRAAGNIAAQFADQAYQRQANERGFLANRADTGFSQGMQGAQFGLGQQGQNFGQWAQAQGLGLQAQGQNQQIGFGLADRELARTQYNAARDDTAFGQQMSQAQFGAGRTDQAMQNWLSQQGLGLNQTQANRAYEGQLQQNELARLGFTAGRQDTQFGQGLSQAQFGANRQDAANADFLNRFQAGQGALAGNRGWDLNNRQFDLSRLGFNAGRQDTAFGQGLQQDQFDLGAQNQAFGQNFNQQQFGAGREDQRFQQALQGDQFAANQANSLFSQLGHGWGQSAQGDQFAANRQDQAFSNYMAQQGLGLQRDQFGLQRDQFGRNMTMQDRDYDMQLRNQMLGILGQQQGLGFSALGQFSNVGNAMNGNIQQNMLGMGNAQAAAEAARGQMWGNLGNTLSNLGGFALGGGFGGGGGGTNPAPNFGNMGSWIGNLGRF